MTLREIEDGTKLSFNASAAETKRRTAPQAIVSCASRLPVTEVAGIEW